jgi:hypothetical protein
VTTSVPRVVRVGPAPLPRHRGGFVAAVGGFHQEERGRRADLVGGGCEVLLGEGEVSAVPRQQLLDGRSIHVARACDARGEDLATANPNPADLVVGDDEDLARTPFEIQEAEDGRQAELIEAAAQAGSASRSRGVLPIPCGCHAKS